MKVTIEIDVEDCEDCSYYNFTMYYIYDCMHPDVPEKSQRGEEPSAENRIDNFPKWCPFVKKKNRTRKPTSTEPAGGGRSGLGAF